MCGLGKNQPSKGHRLADWAPPGPTMHVSIHPSFIQLTSSRGSPHESGSVQGFFLLKTGFFACLGVRLWVSLKLLQTVLIVTDAG